VRLSSKTKGLGGVTQVEECLSSSFEVLDSIPRTDRKVSGFEYPPRLAKLMEFYFSDLFFLIFETGSLCHAVDLELPILLPQSPQC
jgi:hypothetical protein